MGLENVMSEILSQNSVIPGYYRLFRTRIARIGITLSHLGLSRNDIGVFVNVDWLLLSCRN